MRYRDVGLGNDLGLLFIHLTLHNLIIGSCLLQISVVLIYESEKLSLQHEQKFVIKGFCLTNLVSQLFKYLNQYHDNDLKDVAHPNRDITNARFRLI